jgi:hypothetical protein
VPPPPSRHRKSDHAAAARREGEEGFTRDPNLLSSISRSTAENLLVSDTTFQALDGDLTKTNNNSQEFKVI